MTVYHKIVHHQGLSRTVLLPIQGIGREIYFRRRRASGECAQIGKKRKEPAKEGLLHVPYVLLVPLEHGLDDGSERGRGCELEMMKDKHGGFGACEETLFQFLLGMMNHECIMNGHQMLFF